MLTWMVGVSALMVLAALGALIGLMLTEQA